jgi:hypothetical protein
MFVGGASGSMSLVDQLLAYPETATFFSRSAIRKGQKENLEMQ